MIRAIAAVSLVLLLAGCSSAPTPDDGAFALTVGDCFDLSDESSVDAVPVLPCEEPHDFEAYASLRMDAAAYPGETDTVAEADARCGQAFEDYVGIPLQDAYDQGLYDYTSFYPSAESWALGDREILCLVYATDAEGGVKQLSESVKKTRDGAPRVPRTRTADG